MPPVVSSEIGSHTDRVMDGRKEGFHLARPSKNAMKLKIFALTLASSAVVHLSALADSITYHHLLTYSGVPSQGNSMGNNYHISGQYTYGMGWTLGSQFDSALGQLESMDWSVSLHSSLAPQFNYWQPPGPVGPGSANQLWTAQYIRIGSLGLDGRYLWSTGGLPTDSENLSVPVGGSATANLLLEGTVTSHITNPSLLNDFVQGTAFYIDVLSKYDFSTAYANGGTGLPNLQVDLSFTYNFTPAAVPEPSSVMLLVLGGVVAGALRRRK